MWEEKFLARVQGTILALDANPGIRIQTRRVRAYLSHFETQVEMMGMTLNPLGGVMHLAPL